ncbi:MAG TPA: phosphatase PAP2 family protein [Gaiellaceae bacterium]|jgi:undecaprenyl-diphosphatase|nr:phosphatase PAP2 family protein [Gaiellaceae bacterium]
MVRGETESPAFLSAAVVAGILAPVALFSALAVRASSVEASGAEQDFVEWLYRRTVPVHAAVDLFLTVGRLGGLLLFGLLAIGLMARGRVRESGLLVVALAGATALSLAAHVVVNGLSSVEDGTTLDFPSGHAAASLSGVGAALLVLGGRPSRLVTALAVSLIVAYGTALVARNWHGPSEVLAGWCLGLAWLGVVRLVAVLWSSDLPATAAAPKST